MFRIGADRIWKSIAAGLCGSVAHGSLMFLKDRMGWLPTFQPYQDLQLALSGIFGSTIQPAVPWMLSFINGTLVIGLVFSLIYHRLPGRSGAAKGCVLGLIGWLSMGLAFFPLLGRGVFATGAGLGLRPAAFSLAMVLAYSVLLGISYAALDRLEGSVRSTAG
ncbi:hypothetical protein JQ543_04000 [Bradyrhizobium diazoefficiens]|nr:hypothetical protein [Bradyrhizobium diazoefficiens]